jgi:hypothetical protein
MALTIRGRVFRIEAPTTNESNGKSYTRRGLILDCTTYDQFTGEPRSNFPRVEFSGDKGVAMLDALSVGQIVEVSFALNGVMYTKEGEEKNFTSVRGFKVSAVDNQRPTAPASDPFAPSPTPDPFAPAPAQAPSPSTAGQADDPDNLPF